MCITKSTIVIASRQRRQKGRAGIDDGVTDAPRISDCRYVLTHNDGREMEAQTERHRVSLLQGLGRDIAAEKSYLGGRVVGTNQQKHPDRQDRPVCKLCVANLHDLLARYGNQG